MINTQIYYADPSKLVCPVFGCLFQIENKPEQKLFQEHVLQCIQRRNKDTRFYGRSRKFYTCPLNHITSEKDDIHNFCRAATIHSGYKAQHLRTILKRWICFPKPALMSFFDDLTIETFHDSPFDEGTFLQGQASLKAFKYYISSVLLEVRAEGSDRFPSNKRKPKKRHRTPDHTTNETELMSQHANINMYSNAIANCEKEENQPPKKKMKTEFTRIGHNGNAPVPQPTTGNWNTDTYIDHAIPEVIDFQSATPGFEQSEMESDNLFDVTIHQNDNQTSAQ